MDNLASIIQTIKSLFPNGTYPGKTGSDRWADAPYLPSDVFGAMAVLLDASGAYEIVQPSPSSRLKNKSDPLEICSPTSQKRLQLVGRAWMYALPFSKPANRRKFVEHLLKTGGLISNREIKKRKDAGKEKQGRYLFTIDELLAVNAKEINSRWRKIVVDCSNHSISLSKKAKTLEKNGLPAWWKPAIELLVMADEAAQRVGYFRQNSDVKNASLTFLEYHVFATAFGDDVNEKPALEDRGRFQTITSELFDASVVAVVPKALLPSVGCSIRSLSHNLALVPPLGKISCSWFAHAANENLPRGIGKNSEPLNLLLIPFPYRIDSECFGTQQKSEDLNGNWNWFRVDQRWLGKESRKKSRAGGLVGDAGHEKNDDDLLDFLVGLVKQCVSEQSKLHGVVLPELALTRTLFERFADRLLRETSLEFLISGLGDNFVLDKGKEVGGEGNFVAMFGRTSCKSSVWDYKFIRSKHHRWNMDARQFKKYGLTHRLNGAKSNSWWESIDVSSREIDIVETRAGSCMTVLICEDLARIDPCQEAIRAIGPNLVIALLMDGPQTTDRWPAYYAGVLSDDPGSSVLTLTSFGLIERSMATSQKQSRSIGLWKDAFGGTMELQLPVESDALFVSLLGKGMTHRTLDNRPSDGSPYSWVLGDVVPLRKIN